MIQQKVCPKCKKTKDVSEFFRNKSRRDGTSYACKQCKLIGDKAYYTKHRKEIQAVTNDTKVSKRLGLLAYYGNGKLACVLCGEEDPRCLSIDHINGGGNKHRKQLGSYGIDFTNYLIQSGLPSGYRTLCMNCQFKIKPLN